VLVTRRPRYACRRCSGAVAQVSTAAEKPATARRNCLPPRGSGTAAG
jgi:hypothetical protein